MIDIKPHHFPLRDELSSDFFLPTKSQTCENGESMVEDPLSHYGFKRCTKRLGSLKMSNSCGNKCFAVKTQKRERET